MTNKKKPAFAGPNGTKSRGKKRQSPSAPAEVQGPQGLAGPPKQEGKPEPAQPESAKAEPAVVPPHVPVSEPALAQAEPAPTEQPPEPAPEEPPEEEAGAFTVVGVGASAGGLEALGELIGNVATDSVAIIVVQHLAPHHESLLTQLLARSSRLAVVTATDGMRLEPNHVYVTPPNAHLALLHGVLRVLSPLDANGPRSPVDYMFRSLAEDQGHSAIGIVLSGTGTDGTFGLKAIRAAGGLTIVQDPETAKYDGMPRSAINSGAADLVLPPKQIGEELVRLAGQVRAWPAPRPPRSTPQTQDPIGKLFVLIRSEFGNDLTNYKNATIDRRIERRMMLHKIGRLEEYVKFVQQHRDELQALYKDMLITVTSFFRDPESFEALKSKVFPQILEHKEAGQPIRVWVPACATGEEAYSLAMCLLEFCEEKTRDERIQIFGTDIDEESIQHARRGVYSTNIALDVSPERLNRFFIRKGNEYLIARQIRDMLVFSTQNVLKDAPFSRMDLVSCRNLLIYLQPSAQKKVLRVLHYALNPSGYLLLGTSETVGDAPELFSSLDFKNKIYAKKLVASQTALDVSFGVPVPPEPPQPAPPRPMLNLQGLADRKVLELYGPPGVVISENLEILQFRGHTGTFLDPAPGAASFNLLKVTRFEFHIELKRAIQQVLAESLRVTKEVSYQEDGKPHHVKLDVVPVQDPESKTRCVLVLFQRMPPPKEVPGLAQEEEKTGEVLGPLAQRIQELERELAVTKECLQTTIEEKEGMLEELKSANEELQSSNEELQSSNEELETSKEEMQSTNEELTTVNDELQNRMAELSQTNDDLYNVLSGVDNAVVIVGMDLRIRRYTGAAEKLFHLVPGDIGRSIGFLDSFVGAGPLEPKVATVIQSLSAQEEEVLAINQHWYTFKITPYKTLDHAIRGALVTFVDIDVSKRAAEMTKDVSAYAAKFLAAINHPLLIIDKKLRVVWTNEAFLSIFQLTEEESVGSSLQRVGSRQFSEPRLREHLDAVFDSALLFRDYELRFALPEGREQVAWLSGSKIPVSAETPLALLSIEQKPSPLAKP